ncbi:MAG: hypothetical protein V7749_00725 [Cocleimonas sp.]
MSQQNVGKSIIRNGLRPQNPKFNNRKTKLTFLRKENFLPPSHPNQIPVTAHQIKDLLKWSGETAQNMAKYICCPMQSFRMWSNTNRSITDNKIMPPTIWHYMSIRLGLVEQERVRRIEPDITVTHTYDVATDVPFILRAVINYHSNEIVIYNDSALNESSSTPLTSITAEFQADIKNEIMTISGEYRSATAPWMFENPDDNQQIKNINNFLNESVWPACWKLHDYYSLQPKMFLKPESLLPITDKEFKLPNSTELYRFCRWLGATPADIAAYIWENPTHLRFLVSNQAKEDFINAKEDFKKLDTDTEEEKKNKDQRLANQYRRCRITPQGWSILVSATGLTPTIPVIGRTDPRKRYEKIFKTKEVSGVPIEYVKLLSIIDWTDTEKNNISITYSLSTQERKGEEITVSFPITEHKGSFEIFGSLFEEDVPKEWLENFVIDDKLHLSEQEKEWVFSWLEKAMWRYTWRVILHEKLD